MAPQQIERKVGRIVDWLVAADLKQWQAVTITCRNGGVQYRGRIVGDPPESGGAQFHYDRTRLIEAVGREAQRSWIYDRIREAQELADGARNAVATAAAVGAGALGLGTIVTIAATTGRPTSPASSSRPSGRDRVFILPAKRQRAKKRCARRSLPCVAAVECAARTASARRSMAQRRSDSRGDRPLQPFHSRRGRQAADRGAGAARDCRVARGLTCADRPFHPRACSKSSG